MTNIDTRCLTCGEGAGAICVQCGNPAHQWIGKPPGPHGHHPFVPTPSTTDRTVILTIDDLRAMQEGAVEHGATRIHPDANVQHFLKTSLQPAPSTTDAIAEALRRVQQAHMCPKCGSLIDCVKEAAIVAREQERYEARITDLKRASDVLYGLMPAFLNDDTAWQMAMGDMHAALAALDKPVQP